MKKTQCLLIWVIAISTLISLPGCTSMQSKKTVIQISQPRTSAPVIAVLPFSSPDYNKLKPQERQIRNFERSYFASRLIMALGATRRAQNVYFSPTVTPAADYNVEGKIAKSDGKMTVVEVSLRSAAGKVIWDKSFSINTSTEDFKKLNDPAGKIWPQVATAVIQTKQKAGDFQASRVLGFSPVPSITDKSTDIAEKGAVIVRESLLAPATRELVPRAQAAGDKYIAWQRNATPLVEQRSQQKTAEVMGGISMFLGAVGAGASAYTGNTAMTQANSQAMLQGAGTIDVAAAKVYEINQTLALASQSFNWDKNGKPISVKVFGQVYLLTGSLQNQETELRKAVGSKLMAVN